MDLQNTILAKLTASIPAPPMRLRDLIRQIRATRTAADERAVIQKECAYIRSTFREEDNVWRCRNVAKLLYIHMLGYPAHFGQLECLKLIASPRFTDKRIGYLGAMLLLDERQDVHLLITNSLKNDLNSQTQFVVGLALCALGSICSPEMSRDLAGEVERLMKSSNTFIKKKAALCAARIIRKVPEFMEMFLPAACQLVNDKNHAVLITGITLITEMCERNQDTLEYFKRMVDNLVRILKNLIMAGYSPEHDVCGVSDPFLQVKILRLLRILGRNDEQASEKINDILAQVATNTESTKNVGNAILYETVISIMEIKSQGSLRVLAVNILGRFLLNNDKNIRYVALTTLLKTVQADYDAVQRHRATIVDCLKDPDISIRKKAMELCFALVNTSNIKSVTKELIYFLEKADSEFKSICSSNLCICAEKFAPNTKWHIDIMIRVLTTAGNYVRDDVVGNLIQLISSASTLHAYAVQQLWLQLKDDLESKQPLLQVAAWTIGEFADLLNVPYVDAASPDSEVPAPLNVSDDDVITMFETILASQLINLITKEYMIEALMKLSVRFPNRAARVKTIMDVYGCHMNIELQQRAVEFCTMFSRHEQLRPQLLEKMPPLPKINRTKRELIEAEAAENGNGEQADFIQGLDGDLTHSANSNAIPRMTADSNALLDLLGDTNISTPDVQAPKQTSTVLDLLSDLDLGNTNNSSTKPFSSELENGLLTGLSETESTATPSLIGNGFLTGLTNGKAKIPDQIVFNKNGLKITFSFEKSSDNPKLLLITLSAINEGKAGITDFLFQAAVPKTFQLMLLPPTGASIQPACGDVIKQTLKVLNQNNSQLKMKIRVAYTIDGVKHQDQEDVKNFPQEIGQS